MRIALALLSALLVLTVPVFPGHASELRTSLHGGPLAAVDVPYAIEAEGTREQLHELVPSPTATLHLRVALTAGNLLRVTPAAPSRAPSYHPRRPGPRTRSLDPDSVH